MPLVSTWARLLLPIRPISGYLCCNEIQSPSVLFFSLFFTHFFSEMFWFQRQRKKLMHFEIIFLITRWGKTGQKCQSRRWDFYDTTISITFLFTVFFSPDFVSKKNWLKKKNCNLFLSFSLTQIKTTNVHREKRTAVWALIPMKIVIERQTHRAVKNTIIHSMS